MGSAALLQRCRHGAFRLRIAGSKSNKEVYDVQRDSIQGNEHKLPYGYPRSGHATLANSTIDAYNSDVSHLFENGFVVVEDDRISTSKYNTPSFDDSQRLSNTIG